MTEEKNTLIITPFEGCNFQTEYTTWKKEDRLEKKKKPFPHNMQLDNTKVLQEENYHLFNDEAAIFLKDAKYVSFQYLLFNIPYFKMGEKLIIIGYKIMLCNPHFTQVQLFHCLYHIFVEFCHIPKTKRLVQHVKKLGNNISFTEGNKIFTDENIERIKIGVEQIMSTPYKGNIKKQPKVIFNPDYDLTTEDKRKIAPKLQGKNKSNNTLEKIYSTFINWDSEEKPTQVNIAKKLNINEKTVKNYWKKVKEKVSVTI